MQFFFLEDDNFYAGGSSHRWIQYYTTAEDVQKDAEPSSGTILTMDEFIASTSNPLAKYFLQPEESQPSFPSTGPRLELGMVKESWVEKEMRARESAFTEYGFMQYASRGYLLLSALLFRNNRVNS